MEKGGCKIPEIVGVIGLMVDYTKGVEYGKGHYGHLEQEKIRALTWNKGDFEATWKIGKKAREDLNIGCETLRLQIGGFG